MVVALSHALLIFRGQERYHRGGLQITAVSPLVVSSSPAIQPIPVGQRLSCVRCGTACRFGLGEQRIVMFLSGLIRIGTHNACKVAVMLAIAPFANPLV